MSRAAELKKQADLLAMASPDGIKGPFLLFIDDAICWLRKAEAERDTGLQYQNDLNRKVSALTAERDNLRKALEEIANGEGYYGAQAREYKAIAKAALSRSPK